MHWTNIEFKMKFNLHCHSNIDLMSKKKLKTKKVRVEHRGGGHLEFDSFPGEPKEVTRRLLGLWRTGNLARKKFTNQTSKMPNSHYYSFKIIIMHEPTTIYIYEQRLKETTPLSAKLHDFVPLHHHHTSMNKSPLWFGDSQLLVVLIKRRL